MTTLVFDALVQPHREVGEHLLTHSARYVAQFRLNCILHLRNISWLVDVHFSFEVSPQKRSQVGRSGEQAGHVTSPLWERSFPGKNLRNSAIASLEVWVVAPSCWNQIRNLFNRRLRNAGTRKSRIMAA